MRGCRIGTLGGPSNLSAAHTTPASHGLIGVQLVPILAEAGIAGVARNDEAVDRSIRCRRFCDAAIEDDLFAGRCGSITPRESSAALAAPSP
jgi:hypothetical protein